MIYRTRSPVQTFLAAVLLALFAVLQGCATQPETFRDKMAVASASATWATVQADSLAKQGKISKKQAMDAYATSKAASASLDTATDLEAKKDLSGADAALSMASAVLKAVKNFLISNGAVAP